MARGISMRYGNVKGGGLRRIETSHPEFCAEAVLRNEDGRLIFVSMIEALKKAGQLKMVGQGKGMFDQCL